MSLFILLPLEYLSHCSAPPETELRWRGEGATAQSQSSTVSSDQPDGQAGSKEPAPKAPTKPQRLHEAEKQQGLNQDQAADQAAEQAAEDHSPEALGAWNPLLANVCLCTALALGAYVCYRACFH